MLKSQESKIENIRHSLAHLLAMAVLKKFPKAKLGIGPVIENGFYYDFKLPHPITEEDLKELEMTMRELIARNMEFSGEKVTPLKARKIFKGQLFKLDLIKDFVKEKKQLTVYYTCPKATSYKLQAVSCFTDLCRGGHIQNTLEINPDAFRLTKIAGAYWKGSEKNPQLTRIYAVAFETKTELDDYFKLQEEIQRRDHRILGERLELFMFSDIAPGAPIWLPRGMVIFRELEKLWRALHDKAGYLETSTPIMVKADLFKRSGHWDYYRENMFYFDLNKETYALKPMNCPESTLVYSSKTRSYRDLPLRLSEIGRLHRNELSGAIGGMFRVKQLTMDDAHIYCREDQMQSEMAGILKLIDKFYKLFNFRATFRLATKPEKALGSGAIWKLAEDSLDAALKSHGIRFEILKGEGAFYGPKIHYDVKDVLGREWTLATIQIDFQMPERFDLSYIDQNGRRQRPVMIHRAIFGSFERFLGILLEHYAGALPFWLSPIQLAVLPINDKVREYCLEIIRRLRQAEFRVILDGRNESIGRKIREAEIQKIPYLLVIGEREVKNKTISLRERGRQGIDVMGIDKLTNKLYNLMPRP